MNHGLRAARAEMMRHQAQGAATLVSVSDYYVDLAVDYHWLFQDQTVTYPGRFGDTSPGNGSLLDRVLDELPAGAAILDSACGIGADAMALAHRGFKVTASDGSPSMAAEARRRLAEAGLPVKVIASRWEDLSRHVAEKFDLVLCLGNALVHASGRSEMVQALRALRELLLPGGTLVVDSRNWELLHRERPRIVPSTGVRIRGGIRCVSLYVWTIPDRLGEPCDADIVLLFEGPDGEVTHHRYAISFRPFGFDELLSRVAEAGLAVADVSFEPQRSFYAIAATVA